MDSSWASLVFLSTVLGYLMVGFVIIASHWIEEDKPNDRNGIH